MTGPAAFRFRMGTHRDVPHCLAFLPRAFRADASMRARLPELWGRVLDGDAKTFAIVEDLERPYPDGIEAYGLSVFVSDRFAEAFRASPRPGLAAAIYERLLAGDDVLMTAAQLAKANATTGINIAALHFGLRNEDLADARTAHALMAGSAAFYFFHGGWRINTIFNEVYGTQAARFMEAGGFRLVHDYARESPGTFGGVPPGHMPYLFMLCREWVEPGAINPLSQLFFAPAPRIGFSAAERRVLERALLTEADPQIAASLGVSADSVKKTWRNIYDRTKRRAPFLLPANDSLSSGSRGQEKRRHLLGYLRTHLEELRPFEPALGADRRDRSATKPGPP